MSRIMAGGAVTLLLTTGAFLFWQGHAATRSGLPDAPRSVAAATASGAKFAMLSPELPALPEATSKTREEKRFSRGDKDKDGKITEEELLAPRRKAFAKLDVDHNGMLSFTEWAAKTINKFDGADEDKDGALTAAEYAETAPKPKHHSVRCT
ncbi:MAG: histidine kinase [Pseudomonadota bacterium]|nr:histidine kinase [Pseudomonadota bacterium]